MNPSILKDWELFKRETDPFGFEGIPENYHAQTETIFLCGALCGLANTLQIVGVPTLGSDIHKRVLDLAEEIKVRVSQLSAEEDKRKARLANES
jgi:hypothetical protein